MDKIIIALADIAYLVAAVFFIMGIKKLSSVKTARQGNFLAAVGMFLAIVVTLLNQNILPVPLILVGLVIGGGIGLILATKVQMTGMPQLVAALNGFGGIASLLVAGAEYYGKVGSQSGGSVPLDTGIAIVLSIIIGGVTFTGSFIAFGKLQGLSFIPDNAVNFPGQHLINLLLIIGVFTLGGFMNASGATLQGTLGMDSLTLLMIVCGIALVLGILLVIPIGGADMPVVISLLNSYSGIAAAMTGFVLKNNVLIITGALVGASGIVLTQIMCVSMNRSLLNVLMGGFGQKAGTGPATAKVGGKEVIVKEVGVEEAAMIFEVAQSVLIVPGYGMAVAQAQHVVKELCDILLKRGATVKFAIHPVAGRMPGHMNVLLAESNVPYELLFEMDEINDEFNNTDIALVIGANDVTNPAARHDEASPIYGMPILNVDKARTVIINKRSLKPGYAGIDNELYGYENALMYFGDAKEAIAKLNTEIKAL